MLQQSATTKPKTHQIAAMVLAEQYCNNPVFSIEQRCSNIHVVQCSSNKMFNIDRSASLFIFDGTGKNMYEI